MAAQKSKAHHMKMASEHKTKMEWHKDMAKAPSEGGKKKAYGSEAKKVLVDKKKGGVEKKW